MIEALFSSDNIGPKAFRNHPPIPEMKPDFEGETLKCRAAVAWGGKRMSIEMVDVEPPKEGEVRIKILFNALCHTDLAIIDGMKNAQYPTIPGHEATAAVESVGPGVSDFQPGDIVMPLPIPQCKKCEMCLRGDTNLCVESLTCETAVTCTMADGTTRIKCQGKEIFSSFGLSCFSEYTVVKKIALVKINPHAPVDRVCLVGCGLATGYGAAINTAKIKEGDSVAIIGVGCIGLSAVQGAKHCAAKEIICIDRNEEKFQIAEEMGATKCINPLKCPNGKKFSQWFLETIGPVDQSIECVGDKDCMRWAVEIVKKGYGRAVILGIPPEDQEISFSPLLLLEGRTVVGGTIGDWHTVDDLPKLVDKVMNGELETDQMITHRFQLEQLAEAIELMKTGKCIRVVFQMANE
ncbi:unnamed protein product, partial [Mesorhabditis belari]|uniref:Enoyl reductase (ER) domain-containing protein n=1 Tax=Mesorhabditis belari TaxID=2138241 RepID=A0AAF3FKI4_9BILA